jgi:hypothetical protein
MRCNLGLLFVVALSTALLHAQTGPCTESAVKKGDLPSADDAFAYMPPYGKPVVGKPEIKQADTKSFSDRANIKRRWVGEHRIVSSQSGDITCLQTARAKGPPDTRSSKR